MKIKDTIKDSIKKLRTSGNNLLSNGSNLSENQINMIEAAKKQYLDKLRIEDQDEYLRQILAQIGLKVTGSYLPQMASAYFPVSLESDANLVTSFDITKWVCDPKEKNIEKLANVYQVLADEACSIALMYHRTQDSCTVTMTIANHGKGSDEPGPLNKLEKRVRNAILGNFPGAEFYPKDMYGKDDNRQRSFGVPEALTTFQPEQQGEDRNTPEYKCCVAAVTNLPSDKSEDFISQGIEKLLDGMIPNTEDESYTLMLLATPCHDVEQRKLQLCQFYTALSPLASWQSSQGFNTSLTDSAMANISINSNVSHSVNASVQVGVPGGPGASAGVSNSVSLGVSYGKTFSSSQQVGESKGITQTTTNYEVKHTLDILEEQVKRFDQCSALGMWDFAAYVISKDPVTVKNVAYMYLSLTQGEKSYVSQPAINVWEPKGIPVSESMDNDVQTISPVDRIMDSLNALRHPLFYLKSDLEDTFLCYPTVTAATTCLSGSELAHALNFPLKSISGLPVCHCVPFGREVIHLGEKREDKIIHLGSIYHMRHKENIALNIDCNSLTSHTFITGSTGTGKSNTVYQLLNELCPEKEKNAGTKFLVIEPAKGEYRQVFGHRRDVQVYGTNPKIAQLLKINPFSFPDGIHIYEHMDRLVEVFNVCWPMYAAMPAVLKEAIERSYLEAGWDLTASKNKYSNYLFPTFADVLRQIDIVMNESQYSADSKGDYKGALSTRVKSLTNGINGMIFSAEEISSEALFDKNVIIDLSRVGSTETKSLIMGLLIIKLQEHRMVTSGINEGLKHITVLEEAHNLLKRTSTEQSSESANLLGKSVEMLTNAIAEMRTYGEGFVIADQAPGLLDIAVIRNTNTKIVLRLPEYSDRELVGRAMGLNDDQIEELSRLEKGVAAVYQNDWIEAVLCKVDKFEMGNGNGNFHGYLKQPETGMNFKGQLLQKLMVGQLYTLVDRIDCIDGTIIKADIPAKVKCRLYEYVNQPYNNRQNTAAAIAFELLDCDQVIVGFQKSLSAKEKKEALVDHIKKQFGSLVEQRPDNYMDYITCYLYLVSYWAARKTEDISMRELASQMMDKIRTKKVW